jgi:hypothetical protein
MSVLHDITELLTKIRTSGSFAARRTTSAHDLHLEVKGVGGITWPISTAAARRLCAAARPARYGLKDQTRLDPRVRNTFEILKTRIRIDERKWKKTFWPMLDRIRGDLGLPEGARLKSELHNMLVYGPGQFFVTHQDSEKGDDMIGTLVVILPSAFTGGAMVVEHHDEQLTFRAAGGKLTFIAFYADCHHQVRPVTGGYRVVLTYNLLVEGDLSPAIASTVAGRLDSLAESIQRFFETPLPRRWAHEPQRERPDRFVYLLDHQYTRRSLAWRRLKNADAVRAAALREVALRLDCDIVLALADVHESWSSEDEGFDYRRYGRRGSWWRGDYDEDADEDPSGSEMPALLELLDSDIELRHWTRPGERLEAIAGTVDRDEVCYTKPSVEFEPFASEHEGYMGNWGNTVDRWYHRAAVVLWPRARTFVIRAKAAPSWAIGELATALKSGEIEKARGMVNELGPFWSRVAPNEKRGDFLARTLGVAGGLDNPELAASLLEPFTLQRLTPSAASRLIPLADRYGLEWCVSTLEGWTAEKRRAAGEPDAPWVTSLPSVCRALCDGGSANGIELARWLVRRQWARVFEHVGRLSEHSNPEVALEAVSRMSKPILGLLESSRISNSPELQVEMTRFLTSLETEYPIRGLVHLLRTAHETRRSELPGLGLATVHGHSTQVLRTRLGMPAREEADWSISAPLRCRCRLCETLARFLCARDQVRLEWPLAKDQRSHIHQVIDAHDLPVTHVTRRTGRPFTLVLVKTDALFEREAAERKLWQRDLKWLVRSAPAFEDGPQTLQRALE